MIQNLVILGFLKKGPASGYDIKKFIKKELGIFSHLDNQSIYYPLRQMESRGFITSKLTRGAQKLEKKLYSLTAKGGEQFVYLCKQALLSQERPFMEVDIVLYFMPYLDTQDILPLLRLRLRFLQKVRGWLEDKKSQLPSKDQNLALLIEHHDRLAETERDFLRRVIDYLRG